MKIGLVTFHDASNYGAVLQAYALRTVIAKLGYESEFIRFLKEEKIVEKNIDQIALFKKYPRLEQKQKEMIEYKEIRDEKFEIFIKNYLKESEKIYTVESYDELNNDYEMFIAGSDQIWNYEITGMTPVYFLNFADEKKRHSYAASFGVEKIPENLQLQYKQYLNGFNKISVREQSGLDIINKLSIENAEVCVDPTLLLEGADWGKLIQSNKEESPYVLLYALEYSSPMIEFAKKTAKDNNWELIVVSGGYWIQMGAKCWYETGVTDFVTLVKNAEAVFTNSFHGLILSIVFHKKFYLYQLNQLATRNTRITNLLNIAGIDNIENINWDEVDSNLEKCRASSLEYLKGIIGG